MTTVDLQKSLHGCKTMKITDLQILKKKFKKFEPVSTARRIVDCHGEVSHGFPCQSSFLLPHERRWLSPTQPPAIFLPPLRD